MTESNLNILVAVGIVLASIGVGAVSLGGIVAVLSLVLVPVIGMGTAEAISLVFMVIGGVVGLLLGLAVVLVDMEEDA